MKGVQLLRDESHKKWVVQIDLSEVERGNPIIEDLMDVLLAEAAKDTSKTSWEDVKRQLKKTGKLR